MPEKKPLNDIWMFLREVTIRIIIFAVAGSISGGLIEAVLDIAKINYFPLWLFFSVLFAVTGIIDYFLLSSQIYNKFKSLFGK